MNSGEDFYFPPSSPVRQALESDDGGEGCTPAPAASYSHAGAVAHRHDPAPVPAPPSRNTSSAGKRAKTSRALAKRKRPAGKSPRAKTRKVLTAAERAQRASKVAANKRAKRPVGKLRAQIRSKSVKRANTDDAKRARQVRANVVCSRARCQKPEFVLDHVKRACAALTIKTGPPPLKLRACLMWRALSQLAKKEPDKWVCADCRKLPPASEFKRPQEISEAQSHQTMLRTHFGPHALLEGTPL